MKYGWGREAETTAERGSSGRGCWESDDIGGLNEDLEASSGVTFMPVLVPDEERNLDLLDL